MKDTAFIPKSSTVSVNGGELYFGRNFNCNYGFFVSCGKYIKFGDNCAIGWNCSFFDGDGHNIYSLDGGKNEKKAIVIGDHSWICAECTFLKGAQIANDTVVSYGTVVSKRIDDSFVIIGGNPVRRVKKIDKWEK